MRGLRGPNTPRRFTPREREVLVQLSTGCTNDEIAVKLDCSVNTIRTHVSNMLTARHVHSKVSLVAIAFDEGIVMPRWMKEAKVHAGLCVQGCGRIGTIWLCGEGHLCEPCFRELGDVPPDVDVTFDATLKLSADLEEYVQRAQDTLDAREDEESLTNLNPD
jgi:DNA-binding CsgD family transcriptional regulator